MGNMTRVIRFIQMWREHPLRGNDPQSLRGIHIGGNWEAELRADDIEALLASHKDLLEALEALLGEPPHNPLAGEPGHIDYPQAVLMARSAIAKARGEEGK